MDAIELLTQQHSEAKDLFELFRTSQEPSERSQIATQATQALRAHTAIEEEIFYPAVRQADDDLDSEVLEGLEEHHVVEVLLDELEGMSSSDEHYEPKFTVISELVEHHAGEEEDEMFPDIRTALGDERLQELGEQMQTRHEELMADAQSGEMTREELYERAKELDVEGRSRMSKRQLANAVQSAL